MNIYVSGGAKSGKSEFAEDQAIKIAKENCLPLYYVATMIPKDREDLLRVERHREMRKDKGFNTLEIKVLEDFSKVAFEGVFLIDSVTALLENVIFDEEYNVDENGWKKITEVLLRFMEQHKNVVFVSDYIYGDGYEYDRCTEIYRENLAMCDKVLAGRCDHVFQVIAGCHVAWK